ncbi:MAG: hypothetical protein KBT47_02410, partial [Armatimonadetes bacterium]|nr:hypothetical protein [Candidatus Hippobium faecium]
MKKLLLAMILIIASVSLFADVIRNISEDLLNACLSNMQVGDPGFAGDKPTLRLGNDPYSWKLTWTKGATGTGYVGIPVGAFADTQFITVRYRVNSVNNANITIKNIYNKPNDAENPYRLMGSLTEPNAYTLKGEDLTVGEVKEITFENTRRTLGDGGYSEIVNVEFSGEGTCEFELFDIYLFNSKGEKYSCFDYDWSMRNFEMPPNYKEGKLFTRDHTVYIGMSTVEASHPDGQARIKRLKELVPNLGCDGGDLATLLALNRG